MEKSDMCMYLSTYIIKLIKYAFFMYLLFIFFLFLLLFALRKTSREGLPPERPNKPPFPSLPFPTYSIPIKGVKAAARARRGCVCLLHRHGDLKMREPLRRSTWRGVGLDTPTSKEGKRKKGEIEGRRKNTEEKLWAISSDRFDSWKDCVRGSEYFNAWLVAQRTDGRRTRWRVCGFTRRKDTPMHSHGHEIWRVEGPVGA